MPDRNTDWRQGSLLTRESSARLNLACGKKSGRHAIVISHDCDLLNRAEPSVEVIFAHAVERADPQLSYAKNPRRLHLVYELLGEEPLVLELQQTRKCAIPRHDFFLHARSRSSVLTDVARRTLKQWLAARYGRPAFPNTFEERLHKKANAKRDVKNQIARILRPESEHLVALFFDLGTQRHIEVDADEPYALSISVVYDATEGGPAARQSAERVAQGLNALFTKAYGAPEDATEIALDSCEAVAETHMTLADLRRVDQWRLEHLSLNDNESSGDFLATGELPP